MDRMDSVREQSEIMRELVALLDLDISAVQEQNVREGWDLPVMVFWGFAVTSLILATLLAFELWVSS